MCVICVLFHLVYVRYIWYYITINREQATRTQSRENGEKNMSREERTILETIVFAYLVGQCNWSPIRARAKVESMTYEELDEFVN